jgi:hypothetical protein
MKPTTLLISRLLVWCWLPLGTLPASAVTRYVDLNSPSPVPPYTNWLTAAISIQDAVDAANPGDTVLVTNGVYATGGKAVYGTMTNRVAVDKPLSLFSVNGPEFTIIQGNKAPGGGNGDGAVRCVYLTNGANLSGFTLTNGASRTVFSPQAHESGGGALWCESATAWVSNCVLIGNSGHHWGGGAMRGTLEDCLIQSNSAGAGGGAVGSILIRCILTGNSAGVGGATHSSSLTNCTLVGNAATHGGGAAYGTLDSCTLVGNSASSSGGGADGSLLNNSLLVSNTATSMGGGAYNGRLTGCLIIGNMAAQGGGVGAGRSDQELQNCVLVGNAAHLDGGGAFGSRLKNCTISGNSAGFGGGVYGSSLSNCIVYSNSATNSGDNHWGGLLNHSCTTPMPTNGIGNITNAPQFVDTNGWADLRLQQDSPCINAGNNAYVTSTSDLDGNPRIVGGTVDIGAYEFQSPSSLLSYAWAQQYGLPTDGTADFTDDDGDGHNNWQEWRADTNPTNALSALRMVGVTDSESGLNVAWQSVSTRSYFLERATHFGNASPFQSIATNIAGASGTRTYTDTIGTSGGPYFYRVGVH